jgi:predicted nucleic acid-binding protein
MLLDTSGLRCLFHGGEFFHSDAVSAYRAAGARLTHGYVLAEFVALTQSRRLPRQRSLGFITDLVANRDIEMVWVDESLHHRAVALLQTRPGKTCSLCDAISFVLMKDNGFREALTTDHHFEQEDFQRLLS